MTPANTSKHVVIVGGGFAGIACARELARHADVRITLLDKNNYHQFQPLLYQVATSQLAPGDIAYSLRKVFYGSKNVDVKLAEVASVDSTTKAVTTTTGEVYRGDYLVLAVGSQANFFKTPGADRHTLPMYSLDDAVRLRSRILQVFEDACRNPKLIDEGALNFVIVGAGATGVETAGALAELIQGTMTAEYPDLAVSRARIHLVDHGQAVLAPFSDKAHDYAEKVLRDAGVQLLLKTGVKEVGAGHVLLSDDTTIKTRVVVWAGGLMAAPLAGSTGLPQGRGGRIDVQPDLTVTGFPAVYVLGDVANTPDPAGGTLPQLGSVAQQAGLWAATNILADIAGQPRTAFQYHDKGIMAMITRRAAVAEIGAKRHELHGWLAAAAWRGVHVALLSGVRNKLDAFVKWTWSHFSEDRGPQVLDRTDAARIDWEDDAGDVAPLRTPPSVAVAIPPAVVDPGSRSTMNVLAVDVGGTHVKILAVGQKERREFSSGPSLTAEQMALKVKELAADWKYDAVSIGYPGPVLHGRPVAEPHNLASGWVGFDYGAAFGCPVKLINDAAMQALGSYKGGKMLFLGLGTGLGSAMILDGIVEPMELGHLPYKKGTYEDYVGIRGFDQHGKKKWCEYVADVVALLIAALEPNDVVLGGGNVMQLNELPPSCRGGDNANAFLGGFRLWEKKTPNPQ